MSEVTKTEEVVKPIRLDFGCGPNKIKEEGKEWLGVDSLDFPGVDLVLDLTAKEKSIQNKDFSVTHTYKAWPWADNSVDEIHCSHFLEHLTADERVHFVNECYRVLKTGAQCRITVPHWNSNRAYGDLTHKWPPVAEMWFYYLSKEWRAGNAPHSTYNAEVNFVAGWGYSMHQSLLVRNQEHQQYALANFKEAAQDIIATLTKA